MTLTITDIKKAATSGAVTVDLVFLDEGYDGDYNAADPSDAPLYRIDVQICAEYPGAEPNWGPSDHIEAWGEAFSMTVRTGIVAGDPGTDYRAIAEKAAALVDKAMHAEPVDQWSPKHILAVLSYWTNTDHPTEL